MGRLGDCINSEKYGPIWWCKNSRKECKLEKPEPCDDEKSRYDNDEFSVKLYGVEKTARADYYGTNQYRWYSKYNGARGPWTHDKEKAKSGGIDHELIIKKIHSIK